MKKFIAIISVFALLLSGYGFADSLDLSSMGLEELEQLQIKITEEISKRKGTDFPAGYKMWYDYGLGQYLPDPMPIIGKHLKTWGNVQINTDASFSEYLDEATKEDYDSYIKALKDFGYNENIQSYGTVYTATWKGKYTVAVAYADLSSVNYSNYMMITLDIAS